jgi:RHS repeat-associated protein
MHCNFNFKLGQRIALRDGGTLYWLLTDHLGGTAYTVSGTTRTGELRYRPFGVTRFASGTTPTSVRFTGQREEAALGLYYYNARWYDPALGHFLSPDTLVPEAGNALDYHRYAYVRFNPLKYEDGSGHCATLSNGQADLESDYECWQLAYSIYGFGQGLADRFAADWRVSPEEWLTNVASQSFADADYLRPFAERYHDEWASQVGLPVDPVQWHPPVNPSVWLPGQGLAETVVTDISLCRKSWQDCGRALDDASLAASSVAVGCGMTGIAPCAAIASGTSTVLGIGGTVITAFSVTQEKATSVDLAIAVTTTAVGGRWGAEPGGSMLVGFATSVVQWVWDHWER